jgi:hypothetical protein
MPFAITIFISAFLLFQVQPVIARFILPWYGGSPAVWSTCMMFFQVGLLVGYVYAHLLARYVATRNQVFVHAALLLLSFFFLPITPDDVLKPVGDGNPIWGIIQLLAYTVGAPYVLLSSTGPLFQHWYNRRYAGRSPYRLYALSNVGSLLGLLTYPFLVEPRLSLGLQTISWSVGYLLFVAFCLWAGRSLLNVTNGSGTQPVASPDSSPDTFLADRREPTDRPGRLDPLLWVGLAACGSIMLLAVTSKITQDLSVVPFLWVLPLSLYLSTFIISFAGRKWYWRRVWVPLFLLSVGVVAYLVQSETELHIVTMVVLYCAAMFCIVMVCHGELARCKPPPRQLTFFYLMVSLGGALGGAFVTFLAPNMFSAFWELHVGVVLAVILAGVSLFGRDRLRNGHSRKFFVWGWLAGTLVLIAFLGNGMVKAEENTLTTRRNFYGVLRVYEMDKGTHGHRRALFHGQINHGAQLLHPGQENRIASYFSAHSGLGLAFLLHPKRLALSDRTATEAREFNLRVGVVGLGIGAVSQWGLPGDSFRFYEINPEVAAVAYEYFTLLQDSKAEVEVVMGDGRISLERELRGQGSMKFDILAVDAFTGDAIPVHLLTREALALYLDHLSEGGILALQITNRHLDFMPVVFGLAMALDMPAVMVNGSERPEDYIMRTRWILLTKNESFLKSLYLSKTPSAWPADIRDDIIWTDDYSSLLELLK